MKKAELLTQAIEKAPSIMKNCVKRINPQSEYWIANINGVSSIAWQGNEKPFFYGASIYQSGEFFFQRLSEHESPNVKL